MRADDDNLPWPPPPRRAASPARQDNAAPATQIVSNADEYLGGNASDIGRRIAEDHLELFVTGDPVQGVLAELERLKPDFIALHDVGCSSSLKLVGAIAAAARRRVQRLAVRRQGPGVPLAVLQFVELALGAGRTVRIYSTVIDADTQTRQQLAMVLLRSSRLGAVMVGELPAHALTTALQPLQQALAQTSWRCSELLLLPIGSPTTLAAQTQQLARPAGVSVRVTPQAARPNDAWSFVSGAWNRLQQKAAGLEANGARGTGASSRPMALDTARRPGAAVLDESSAPASAFQPSGFQPSGFPSTGFQPSGFPPSTAPSSGFALSAAPSSSFQPSGFQPSGFQPSGFQPSRLPGSAPSASAVPAEAPLPPVGMPPVMPPAAVTPIPMPASGATRWDDYAMRCAKVKGAVAACVFDAQSRRVLAFAGTRPDADSLAIEGIALLEAFEAAARGLDLQRTVRDAIVSIGSHHLLLRPVPDHPSVVLHLVVDAVTGNATLARMQLERIEI